jgi:hypothetical protein
VTEWVCEREREGMRERARERGREREREYLPWIVRGVDERERV